jgi:hypothetical protein
LDCCSDFVKAAQNCVAGRTKSALIAKQARAPIGSHGQRLNFEGELAHVHIFANFPGGLRFACGAFQVTQPLFHEFDDAVADASGPVVEFERRGGKEAAAGESFVFTVGEPIFAERAEEFDAAKISGGTDDAFDEDVARFVHDGALEIFFGAEVSEESTLADAEGGGEFADGESFEAFDGREIDGFAEDSVAGFEAAGAAGGEGRGSDGAGFVAGFRFHALIIARPFVLLQEEEQLASLLPRTWRANGLRLSVRTTVRKAYGDWFWFVLFTVGCKRAAGWGCQFFAFSASLGGLFLIFAGFCLAEA